jgi:hypothetical protein
MVLIKNISVVYTTKKYGPNITKTFVAVWKTRIEITNVDNLEESIIDNVLKNKNRDDKCRQSRGIHYR